VLWAIGGGVTLLDLVVLYNSSQYSVAVPHWGLRGAQASDSHGPQIVDTSPNLIVLLTHCGQLIITKISKFNAIRCLIPRLKCTKSDFPAGKLVFPQIPWRQRGEKTCSKFKSPHLHTIIRQHSDHEGGFTLFTQNYGLGNLKQQAKKLKGYIKCQYVHDLTKLNRYRNKQPREFLGSNEEKLLSENFKGKM